MRALGLDVGSKTIGIARSDDLELAAHPHSVLQRKGTTADVDAVVKIIRSEEISAVVVGIPYDLKGHVGLRAKRVLIFAHALRDALPESVEYIEQDERFTTVQAERVLIAGGVRRDRRAEVIDKQAAALILQGWLDARRLKRVWSQESREP